MSQTISLEGVSFRYEQKRLLSSFDISVDNGEVLALLGRSGCGKTTVLRLILGLAVPEAGVVRIDGTVVSDGPHLRVPPERRNLAVVFQDLALWPHLTVRSNLRFGMAARDVERTEQDHRIATILDRLEISDKADRYPSSLSGGERQRVAIARALVLEPRALLLDEPLSNLDTLLKRELLLLFHELLAERRSTAIYVTHDVREAAALGHSVAVMDGGRIVQRGTLPELQRKPASDLVRSLVRDRS